MSDKSRPKRGEDAAAEKPGEPAAIRDEALEEAVGGMFSGCKGIEKAPELPHPKLVKNVYYDWSK